MGDVERAANARVPEIIDDGRSPSHQFARRASSGTYRTIGANLFQRAKSRDDGVEYHECEFGRYESYDGGGTRHSIQEKQPPRDGILGKKKRMRDGYILERKREENGHPSWDVIILLMTT